jgi:hypothetical protein
MFSSLNVSRLTVLSVFFASIFSLFSSSSVYAVNSGFLDIQGKVDSSLQISVSSANAIPFDPSAANTNIFIGEVIITANTNTTGLRLSVHKDGDLGNVGSMQLLRDGGSGTKNYTLQLSPRVGAPALTGAAATNYGGSWTTGAITSNLGGVRYGIGLSTTASNISEGTYRDRVIFSLVLI